ncbi:hypothetical protein TeGR_g615, partial [Tetraparma gracilis]
MKAAKRHTASLKQSTVLSAAIAGLSSSSPSPLPLDLSSLSLSSLSAHLVYAVVTGRIAASNIWSFVDDLPDPKDPRPPERDLRKHLRSLPPVAGPPAVSSLNLSYSTINDITCIPLLTTPLVQAAPALLSLDLSFTNLPPSSIETLCHAFRTRTSTPSLPPLSSLALSGNNLSAPHPAPLAPLLGETLGAFPAPGLQTLLVSCCSLGPEGLLSLLNGLTRGHKLHTFKASSNSLGSPGVRALCAFLSSPAPAPGAPPPTALPNLQSLDLSLNDFLPSDAALLASSLFPRPTLREVSLCNVRIGSEGVEVMFDRMLASNNLVRIHVDQNDVGDRGCQLIAASLPSMHSLTDLSLAFNKIGQQGISSLMRALEGCATLSYLNLSGNPVSVSSAICMSFALAHHPRLESLSLDNCCLSRIAQSHIVVGIAANRWVPMKNLVGFRVAPPMVEMGFLPREARQLPNEACFRTRRDEQMRNMLSYMRGATAQQQAPPPPPPPQLSKTPESSRSTSSLAAPAAPAATPEARTLPRDNVSGMPAGPTPYQTLLELLCLIPFDEEELFELRRYFY